MSTEINNVETFDLRPPKQQEAGVVEPRAPTASTLPEIHTVRRTNSKHRRRRHRSSYEPRCQDSHCEICRILKDYYLDGWITTNKSKESKSSDEKQDGFALTQVGLHPNNYKFERKTSQLDATINLLSQVLDERIQAERYREAKEISQMMRDMIEKRQQTDRLLAERRTNLTDLMRAQELKNEYDNIIFNAVDMNQIRKHLTNQQAASLSSLRHF